MRWQTVRTVLAKELRETVRDRRTLFMMLVLPTLLYPAILVLVQQLAIFGQRQLSAEPAKIAVAGADPALVRFLDADSAIRVFGSANATAAAVREGKVEAAIVLGAARADSAPTGSAASGRSIGSAASGGSASTGSPSSSGSESTGSASTQSASTGSAISGESASTESVAIGGAATGGAGGQRPDTFALSHSRTFALPEAGTREARILYDGSDDRSQRAQGLARERLQAWNDTLLARRLDAARLPSTFATPLAVADSSVATAEETGGYALGRFLPLILVMMTLLGTFYPAIDLAAGEKERGTLETLLTAPVPAAEIVAGKFTAVALIGLAAAVANLASMLLTFQSGLFRFGAAAQIRFTLPPSAALLIFAALIPLAVLFAATCLGLAVRAQSFKEAQNALTPVQLGATLPLFIVSMPGIDFTPALAVVPVVGVGMFFRELMAGGAPLLPSLLAILSTVVYAGLALVFAARAFGREEVLFGGGSGDAPRAGGWADRVRGWRAAERGVPLPAEAMVFIAFVGLLYFHLGARLQGQNVERGLLVSQYLMLALPAIAFAVLGPYDPRKTLALRPPPPRALLAAVLIALGGVPVGWLIGWLQLQMWEGGAEALLPLQELLTATDTRRAMWLLFLVAVTPAVCEELVFRGVLLQSLSREQRAWRAVLLSAAVFGAFHLSFETALRFLPTMWIGLLMGWVVWHSRSIFASMLMHFLNNAVVVVLLWQPALRPYAFRDDALVWPTVVAGAALLIVGLRLLPRRDAPPISSSVPLATGEP